jgi:protein TonB
MRTMRFAAVVDAAPKLRITLAILVALLVWLVFLFAVGHWLNPSTSKSTPEKPLEMRIVELAPPPAPNVPPAAPAPTPVVKPRQPVDPRPHAMPRQPAPPVPPKPDTRSVQSAAPIRSAPVAEESRPAAEAPVHAAAAPEEKQSGTQSSTSSSDAAAHSIAQPLPELPDDLREQAYQTVATARFVIHVDGSVDVELVKPTPNPRLNQILLEALRKWRFFPALQGGRPVESRQDVRVHFNVN